MSEGKKDLIYSSLEYGYYKPESTQFDSAGAGETYDICDKLGSNILNYHLKKINYILNANHYIDLIKFQYIKKTDGTTENLETPSWEGLSDKMEEYILDDDEEVNNVKVYLKDMRLIGFEICTNKGKNKKIGYGEENEVNKENNLEGGGKLVVGFGFNASKKYGVYSMHFYYADKN